jgi:hypothetical protein
MDYSNLFQQTFTRLGFDVVGVWNVFDPPYDWELGWQCKMPHVDFKPNTVLIMYLQDRVTVVNGRIVELEKIADHYGHNADRIVAVHMHPGLDEIYSGPVKLIEFSNHNYDLMNSLRSQQEAWQHIPAQTKTLNWQCLNGRTCQHRRRAADILQTWDHGVLSYADEIPLAEWAFKTYRGTTNEENFVRLDRVYGSCAFNIVTETLYNEYPGLYSEKTLLAFLAHQIPIIISTPRLVEKLRAQGFDMFDDIVDHSYDTMHNDCRVEQALTLNKNIIMSLCDTENLRTRLEANRLLALNMLPAWYQSNFELHARTLADQLLP